MGFAEGVAAGDEGDCFFVVHGHAGEGFTDVLGGGEGVGLAVGSFGVDVDEAHLDGGEGFFEFAIAGVAFIPEPFSFGSPVDIFLRFPDVGASAGEAEGFEAHGFEGDVTGEDHEVGPGDFVSVFLFDGPEEASGFIEVGVIGPAIEWGEALGTVAGAAAAVTDAVGACAMPGHPDEEGAVVAEVGGPPVLRVGHEIAQVIFEGIEVEFFEFLGVVEGGAHGVSLGRVLVEDFQVELVGPPIAVGHGAGGGGAGGGSAHDGALGDIGSGWVCGVGFGILVGCGQQGW